METTLASQPSAATFIRPTSVTIQIFCGQWAEPQSLGPVWDPDQRTRPLSRVTWPNAEEKHNFYKTFVIHPQRRRQTGNSFYSGSSKAFSARLMKRAIDRIPVINNGRLHPAREQQPTLSADIRGVCVCVTEHRIDLSSCNHVSPCFCCLGDLIPLFFSAVCGSQQTRLNLLSSVNLRVSSDGNKSNSGTFCWWTALRTSASPSEISDTRWTTSALWMSICSCSDVESSVSLQPKSGSEKPVWAGGFPECSLTHEQALFVKVGWVSTGGRGFSSSHLLLLWGLNLKENELKCILENNILLGLGSINTEWQNQYWVFFLYLNIFPAIDPLWHQHGSSRVFSSCAGQT